MTDPIVVTLTLPADCAALVPALRGLEKVLAFGATSHESHLWTRVRAETHTFAAGSHVFEANDSVNDSESGLPHILHAAARLLMARAVELATKESP